MTLAALVRQARGREAVPALVDDGVRAALSRGARTLASAHEVYGLTTGVGALRDVEAAPDGEHGLRLWRSHAAGFGPELDDVEARATMLVRLHQLAAGPSAVSVPLAEALEAAVRSGAVPVLHGYGSIGTADLAALAELALALVGEGSWRHGTPAPVVSTVAADALAFVSSNAMTVALGALAHDDLSGLLLATERVASVSSLALRGSPQAYDERLFTRRDDPGAAAAAARLRTLLAGAPHTPARVQDPFALRTLPQVHGVAGDALDAVAAALLVELASSSENPLPLDDAVLHHGQFLTQRLAAATDAARAALVGVATLVQARLAALVDPRLTGLPAFLAHGPGGSSGVMVLEYVAGDVAARLRGAAAPAALTRTTISIGLEETAGHATQSVLLARTLGDLLPDLLACELVAAASALRLAPDRHGGGSGAADLARESLATLGERPREDHVLGDELRAAAALVRDWAGRPSD